MATATATRNAVQKHVLKRELTDEERAAKLLKEKQEAIKQLNVNFAAFDETVGKFYGNEENLANKNVNIKDGSWFGKGLGNYFADRLTAKIKLAKLFNDAKFNPKEISDLLEKESGHISVIHNILINTSQDRVKATPHILTALTFYVEILREAKIASAKLIDIALRQLQEQKDREAKAALINPNNLSLN